MRRRLKPVWRSRPTSVPSYFADLHLQGRELTDFNLQIVDDAIDVGTPIVEDLGGLLQGLDLGGGRVMVGVDLTL